MTRNLIGDKMGLQSCLVCTWEISLSILGSFVFHWIAH